MTYQYEVKIVANIIDGDRSAEAELVEKYQEGLLTMLRTRAQDPRLIEDVIQESWLVILRKLRAGDLNDPKRLSGFITQIVRNQLSMAFRKNQKLPLSTAEFEHDIESTLATPVSSMENKQLGTAMASLFKKLSKQRDKELLLRFYYYGDSKTELCEHFQLSPASFDAILARARTRFKKYWKKE